MKIGDLVRINNYSICGTIIKITVENGQRFMSLEDAIGKRYLCMESELKKMEVPAGD